MMKTPTTLLLLTFTFLATTGCDGLKGKDADAGAPPVVATTAAPTVGGPTETTPPTVPVAPLGATGVTPATPGVKPVAKTDGGTAADAGAAKPADAGGTAPAPTPTLTIPPFDAGGFKLPPGIDAGGFKLPGQ